MNCDYVYVFCVSVCFFHSVTQWMAIRTLRYSGLDTKLAVLWQPHVLQYSAPLPAGPLRRSIANSVSGYFGEIRFGDGCVALKGMIEVGRGGTAEKRRMIVACSTGACDLYQ